MVFNTGYLITKTTGGTRLRAGTRAATDGAGTYTALIYSLIFSNFAVYAVRKVARTTTRYKFSSVPPARTCVTGYTTSTAGGPYSEKVPNGRALLKTTNPSYLFPPIENGAKRSTTVFVLRDRRFPTNHVEGTRMKYRARYAADLARAFTEYYQGVFITVNERARRIPRTFRFLR